MAVTEADRLEMHLGLRQALGDTVADTVMEHLPPTGWGDVARARDVDRVEDRIVRLDERIDRIEERIDRIEERIDRMETDFKDEFRNIRGSIRVLVASVVAVATGIIVMLVQLNQSISNL